MKKFLGKLAIALLAVAFLALFIGIQGEKNNVTGHATLEGSFFERLFGISADAEETTADLPDAQEAESNVRPGDLPDSNEASTDSGTGDLPENDNSADLPGGADLPEGSFPNCMMVSIGEALTGSAACEAIDKRCGGIQLMETRTYFDDNSVRQFIEKSYKWLARSECNMANTVIEEFEEFNEVEFSEPYAGQASISKEPTVALCC